MSECARVAKKTLSRTLYWALYNIYSRNDSFLCAVNISFASLGADRSLATTTMRPKEERVQLHDSAAGSTTIAERSDEEIKKFIEHNSLVWRFCMYGAIKNLQFFEAYLILILMEWKYDLFQIGVLNAIVFALTYVFEVPSGVIADHWGKKNELLLCFCFYMISFVFYTLGELGFGLLVLASVFYGLGEAFRSGTHKAMIMVWLDRHGLGSYKTFIYSRTRSFSNLGSALNAVLSLLIVLSLNNYQLVFLVSVLPFVAE